MSTLGPGYWGGMANASMGTEPTPQPDIYVTELARKLKFIYKAAGHDENVTIPRQLLADVLVALLEDELVEKRRAEVAREFAEKAEAQHQYMEQLKIQEEHLGRPTMGMTPSGKITFRPYAGYQTSPTVAATAAKQMLERMKRDMPPLFRSDGEVEATKEEVKAIEKKGWFSWK